MKKYVGILLIFLILTTNVAIAVSDDDDGVPRDNSWVVEHSPIVTVDKNSHVTKMEFVLKDIDLKKKNSG